MKEFRKVKKHCLFGTYLILVYTVVFQFGCSEKSEHWQIDNLKAIGGHHTVVYGNPEVVETAFGTAVKFDGEGDMLLVDFNPIGNAKEFTIEVIFNQEASFPDNIAPRFIHIQDPDDEENKRILLELRVNEQNQCYLDGYMRTNKGDLVLIDENLVHPTERWLHAALTYKNNVLTTYINKEKQLTGEIEFGSLIVNPNSKVAIGSRMNQIHQFSGMIKTLKITRIALEPEDFMVLKNE